MGLQAKNPYENDDFKSAQAGSFADLLLGIDHVAYAVHDLDLAIDDHREAFGVLVEYREIFDPEGIEIAVLAVGGSTIQHMAPTRDDSDLAEVLSAEGPGIHHVGYQVADCSAAMAAAEAAGLDVLDDEPGPGIGGTTVVHVDATDLLGTLLQLVER